MRFLRTLFLMLLTEIFFASVLGIAQGEGFLVSGNLESAPENQTIATDSNGGSFLSEEWFADFAVPPRIWRPLQIVHGTDLSDPLTVERFRDQCGLGGLVVNVGGEGYIRNEENWTRFVTGVRNMKNAGMRVWIYDEDGYPSLSAGGVVLEGRPDLWALELAYDPKHDPPYFVRDCYEFTHSSNNVARARRYPNPLNPEATNRFIEVTHRRYRDKLGKELYNYVEAFFTDEPAMMAANLGIIQEEHIRLNVPTDDPQDPNKKCLPVVSWYDDVDSLYMAKYGEPLTYHSLFMGDSPADKTTRRQFWSLLGELDRKRYYGQIRDFCREEPNGPVFSGHTLYEENIIMHVPLDGNKIGILKTFDIPGMDQLNSDPYAYFYGCWQAAAFPCSAAQFIGQRYVMTEISDFSQLHSGERLPADLPTMEATAGWQAAFGVTEFMLYYSISHNVEYRNEESHRNYCRFVGRLNAVLRDAEPVRPILLYYPIEELQEEFVPVPEKIVETTQSERAQRIKASFDVIGSGLSRVQTSFCVIDRQTLLSLTKNPANVKEAELINGRYKGVIFPYGSDSIEYDWSDPNFKEYRVSEDKPINCWEDVARELGDFAGPRLTPVDGWASCVEGAFERDNRLIFVLTNTLREPWQGTLMLTGVDGSVFESDEWLVLDPHSGEVKRISSSEANLKANFEGLQTLVFVSSKKR